MSVSCLVCDDGGDWPTIELPSPARQYPLTTFQICLSPLCRGVMRFLLRHEVRQYMMPILPMWLRHRINPTMTRWRRRRAEQRACHEAEALRTVIAG